MTENFSQDYQWIWYGLSENWMGDKRHQVVLKVTDHLGISVLGPQHRSDVHYGLPDCKDPGYSEGTVLLAEAVKQRDRRKLFKVAVIRFLDDTEYPDMSAGRFPFRFRPVGYIGVGDSFSRTWSGREIMDLLQRIHQNGLQGIRKDAWLDEDWARGLRQAQFLRYFRENRVQVFLYWTNPCQANPHPKSDPATFAYCNLNGKLPSDDLTLRALYCWTDLDARMYMLVLASDPQHNLFCVQEGFQGYSAPRLVTEKFCEAYPASLKTLWRSLSV